MTERNALIAEEARLHKMVCYGRMVISLLGDPGGRKRIKLNSLVAQRDAIRARLNP